MNARCEPLHFSPVGELPALPAAVLELLDLLGRDDVDTTALAARLSFDQALTVKTLRLANSSFYGVPRQVTSVAEAITLLGMRTVRTVVTAAALTGSFEPPVCAGFDFELFWRHAVATAVGARLIATELGADAEAAFTAGLLHDIGQLILASRAPERCEQTRLESDHAGLGAHAAEHWHFPAPIVEAIGGHHVSTACAGEASLVHIVYLADQLVHTMEPAVRDDDALPPPFEQAWLGAGLASCSWLHVVAATEIQTRVICGALMH